MFFIHTVLAIQHAYHYLTYITMPRTPKKPPVQLPAAVADFVDHLADVLAHEYLRRMKEHSK